MSPHSCFNEQSRLPNGTLRSQKYICFRTICKAESDTIGYVFAVDIAGVCHIVPYTPSTLDCVFIMSLRNQMFFGYTQGFFRCNSFFARRFVNIHITGFIPEADFKHELGVPHPRFVVPIRIRSHFCPGNSNQADCAETFGTGFKSITFKHKSINLVLRLARKLFCFCFRYKAILTHDGHHVTLFFKRPTGVPSAMCPQ